MRAALPCLLLVACASQPPVYPYGIPPDQVMAPPPVYVRQAPAYPAMPPMQVHQLPPPPQMQTYQPQPIPPVQMTPQVQPRGFTCTPVRVGAGMSTVCQ